MTDYNQIPLINPDPSLHTVEDVAGLYAASRYAQLKAEGRTQPGDGIFPSVPVSDPDYFVGNAGAIWILHFLFPPLLALVVGIPAILGAIPFVGVAALVHLTHSHALFVAVCVVFTLVYLYLIVWRLILCKAVPGLFKLLLG
jgi:hypothetical protein